MRLLHLVEATGRPEGGGEEAVVACRAVVDAGAGAVDQAVWLIGTAGDEARARRVGLAVERRISPPRGIPELAWRSARSALREGPAPDTLVGWSLGAMALGRLATFPGHGARRVGVMVRPPRPCGGGYRARTRASVGLIGATAIALDEGSAREWRVAGAPDVRTGTYVPNALDERETASRRTALRRQLGLADADAAVVLLGDPPDSGDARRFVYTLGLTYMMGCRVVGILPTVLTPDSWSMSTVQRRRAARLMRAHGRRWGVLEWAGPLEEVLPACDVAVCDVRAGLTNEEERLSAGPVLIAGACARGVPVVLPATSGAEGVLSAGWNVVRAAGRGTRAMAAAMLTVIEDRTVRQEAARRARVLPEVPDAQSLGPVVLEVCRELTENEPGAGRGAAAGAGSVTVVAGAPSDALAPGSTA